MKKLKNVFAITFIAIILISNYNDANGGAWTRQRNTCRTLLKKYTANSLIISPVFLLIPLFSHQGSCENAYSRYWTVYNSYAYAQIGKDISTMRLHRSRWYAIAGMGYDVLNFPPADSAGISQGESSENTEFDTINHVVKLYNFSGALSTSLSTNFGSTLLYVIWIPNNETDSIINSTEVLHRGKVSLEFGNIIANGFLDSSDFILSNVIDSASGTLVRKAVPIPNLQKTLSISNTISMDSISVSIFSEGGYGAFNEAEIINPYINVYLTTVLEGYYNSGINRLNMRDTVTAYLRNISSPFAIVDTSIAVIDSLTFSDNINFMNAPTGKYYIQVNHRNSIETWSKAGGDSLKRGITNFYDFTSSISQAYGSNMILKGSKYCIYSGDVTQDGVIDASDASLVDNDGFNFVSGYVNSDVTGDELVDASDAAIIDNNGLNFVTVMRP